MIYFSGKFRVLLFSMIEVRQRQRAAGGSPSHFGFAGAGDNCSMWTEDPEGEKLLRAILMEECAYFHEGDTQRFGIPIALPGPDPLQQ
jgi:hypothetical protein